MYFEAQDKGEVVYKEWLSEKREGYDLVVYATIRKEFITEKLKGQDINDYEALEKFVLELAKEKEVGKYFHNNKGPAYGAMYKHADGKVEMKHEEFWMNGKRILEENEIKKIIHDSNFSDKANTLING